MTSADARPHTPSISELQAALLAARRGAFAATAADPRTALPAVEAIAARRSARPSLPPGPPSTAAGSGGGGVWLLGTHGGSGARCLATVLPGTRYAGKRWPQPTGGREMVVLVCRSSHRGLASAQEYARQFRDGELCGQLVLFGVVVSADAPGRIPPALRRFERLLSGAVPLLAAIPWQPAWRLGPAQALVEPPRWLTKLQDTLAAAMPQ